MALTPRDDAEMEDRPLPRFTPALPSRNLVLGFAERTRRNLAFIRNAHQQGVAEVHVVTQSVLSLLGIVVFPYEEYFKKIHVNPHLDELEEQGWPHWDQKETQATELHQLLRRIRNATAHGSIQFDSESDQPSDVRLAFEDGQHWRGEISADQLLVFCDRFLQYVEDHVG